MWCGWMEVISVCGWVGKSKNVSIQTLSSTLEFSCSPWPENRTCLLQPHAVSKPYNVDKSGWVGGWSVYLPLVWFPTLKHKSENEKQDHFHSILLTKKKWVVFFLSFHCHMASQMEKSNIHLYKMLNLDSFHKVNHGSVCAWCVCHIFGTENRDLTTGQTQLVYNCLSEPYKGLIREMIAKIYIYHIYSDFH